MKTLLSVVLALHLAFFGLFHWDILPVNAAEYGESLFSIGEPGPKAIGLKVWKNIAEGTRYKLGQKIEVYFRADAEGYLTAVYVTPVGDAIILFPNRETPDNRIAAHKTYTLFEKDSSIKWKAGEETQNSSIFFYICSSPFTFDTIKPNTQAGLSVVFRNDKNMRVMVKKLESVAKDTGFNRAILTLGEKWRSPMTFMGARGGLKSERPDTVTGIQGFRCDIKN